MEHKAVSRGSEAEAIQKPSTIKACLSDERTHRAAQQAVRFSANQTLVPHMEHREGKMGLSSQQTHSPQQHVVQTQRRAHVDPGPRAEPMEATVRPLTFTAQHQFGLQSAVRTSFNLGGSSDPSPAHRGKANLVTPGKVRKGAEPKCHQSYNQPSRQERLY